MPSNRTDADAAIVHVWRRSSHGRAGSRPRVRITRDGARPAIPPRRRPTARGRCGV